jgi:beta-lactamase superfamily II metal-dependent hydrolase
MNRIILLLMVLLPIKVMAQENGQYLPGWAPGMLDLHHIQTGRGDAAFYVFPDGTSMVVDAGDMSESHPRITSPRNSKLVPDDSKTAGEWIVEYVRQFHPKSREPVLDYALITHFHDDHMGEIDATSKQSIWGNYLISGISEVGEHVPIRKFIDRGYPHYDFPRDMKSAGYKTDMLSRRSHYDSTIIPTMVNYWQFIDAQIKEKNMLAEQIVVGSKEQIRLEYAPQDYPDFQVRNICGNGVVWAGWGSETHNTVPQEIRDGVAVPGENSLSIGIKISYGTFDYFTGGDIAGINRYGEALTGSMESQVAPVVGPVDVATLNHHGNRDSQSTYFVRTVRPRVWIQQSWSSDHPGDDVLRRITSEELYPGPRSLFATDMLEANKLVIGDRIKNAYQSLHGHVVVRVYENGKEYKVFILNADSREREIIKEYGPFQAR